MKKDFKVGDKVYFYLFVGEEGICSGTISRMVESELTKGYVFVVLKEEWPKGTMLHRCFATEEECIAALERRVKYYREIQDALDLSMFPLFYCVNMHDQNTDVEAVAEYKTKLMDFFKLGEGFINKYFDKNGKEDEKENGQERKEKLKNKMATVHDFFIFPLCHSLKRDDPNVDNIALEAYEEKAKELFGQEYDPDSFKQLTVKCSFEEEV